MLVDIPHVQELRTAVLTPPQVDAMLSRDRKPRKKSAESAALASRDGFGRRPGHRTTGEKFIPPPGKASSTTGIAKIASARCLFSQVVAP